MSRDQINLPDLRDRLRAGWLLGDGAMATMLHQLGVPMRVCFEELCLTHPDLVAQVHQAYVSAGAQLVQTNTFSGHRRGLERYGLEAQVADINRSAVQIARTATGGNAYVVGTVGSTSQLAAKDYTDRVERRALEDMFEEQVSALLSAGVDGILLETFADLEEMLIAIETVRKSSNVPLIANLAPDVVGVTRDGYAVADAFTAMQRAGADVVGLNCRLGLAGIQRTYEAVSLDPDRVYAAVPNAGILHMVDGDYSYSAGSDYFAEVCAGLLHKGVRVLGGCCGTTPEHIAKLRHRIEELDSGASLGYPDDGVPAAPVEAVRAVSITTVKRQAVSPFHSASGDSAVGGFSLLERVKHGTALIVELDPPKSLNVDKFLAGADALRDAGVDSVTLADNSLGTIRVSNMALAGMLKQRGIEPLVHVACRDRNLIGQQSHLMGLHVLGIQHILLVTGDPTRFGELPGATSVYDVSSIDLTRMVKRLNTGIGFSGQPLKDPAGFVVGTSFNPHVARFDKAIDRLRRKLDAGADYVMTQPIFDPRMFEPIARATEAFGVPVFVGVMPLVSPRNAQFLHNEVPGIRIPDETLRRMNQVDGDDAVQEGLRIAEALLDEAMNHFNGIYLITPFLRYELTVQLSRYVRQRVTV